VDRGVRYERVDPLLVDCDRGRLEAERRRGDVELTDDFGGKPDIGQGDASGVGPAYHVVRRGAELVGVEFAVLPSVVQVADLVAGAVS
jgi:hypothetical protein